MNTTLQSGDPIADGKYIIDSELGEGGLAVVYKVRHATLDTPFAVKILKVTLPSLQERLIIEGQLQASLQHPNVVKVTDVVKVDGFPALVMEFIDGIAMDDYLNEEKPSTQYAEELFLQILDAVEEAHERGIIHRDLKPANVMMQRTRNKMIPKVCDFGLGKNLAKEGQTRTGQQMGTPAYMAPEQIRSTKDVDQRADIFSLGAILYELLTGHRAFRASNTLDLLNAVASQPHPTPRLYISDLEDRYIQAIDGALTKNAQFRIPDCATFRRVLLGEEEWLVGRPSTDDGQGGDTLMSLGLDLMGEGTAQSDTAMGFVDDMAAAPQLSSLVAERRVHHAPNSPNSTVVQSNPNAHIATSQDTDLSEPSESKFSAGVLLGGLLVIAALAVFSVLLIQGDEPTETDQQKDVTVKIENPVEQVEQKVQEVTVDKAAPKVMNETKQDSDDSKSTVDPVKKQESQKKPKKPTTATKPSKPKTTTPTAKPKPKTQPTKTVAPEPAKPVISKPEVQPVEATKPAVEAASGPTGKIVFEKQGSVDSIYLVASNGKKYKSGNKVPVGSYTIKIKCGGNTSDAGKHSVKENKTSTYACNCMMKSCQSK